MEIHGKWFFKELGNVGYQGVLYLSEKHNKLEIIDNLPISNYPVRFTYVYGKTIEGDFTLINVIYQGNFRNNYKSGLVFKTLYCSEIIRGKFLNEEHELECKKFEFEIDGLKEWFNHNCISEQQENGSVLKIEYKKPETLHILIQNWGKLLFDFDESSSFAKDEYNTIYQLKQFATIILETNQKENYKSFISLSNKIKIFFYLIFGIETEILKQSFYDENNGNELIYFTEYKDVIHNFNNHSEFVIQYIEIKDDFEKIINAFIDTFLKLKPTLNIWINFLANDKLKDENTFLFSCQALEAWHRTFMEDKEKYIKGEFNNKFGTPYFKTRIKKILEYFENEFKIIVFQEENMTFDNTAEIITNTRDYYTHHLKEVKKMWNENQILNYTPILIKLIHILMLDNIGVDRKYLMSYFNSIFFSKYTDIYKIPLLS